MRYVIIIVGTIAVIAVLAGIKAKQIGTLIGFGEKMQAMGPPPEVVSTVRAQRQNWEGSLESVGTVTSSKGVDLSNDAPGVISKIRFESGQVVKQGQVLVELDTSVERAQLASIRARHKFAETAASRSRALVAAGAAAQAQLDTDVSTLDSLGADAKALAAQIDRKVVRAPFAGRLGIRAVNLGQYLAPGTPITVLETTQSEYVDFTMPQRDLPVLKNGMQVRISREGSTEQIAVGKVDAIAPSVDPVTRNVKVRALLENTGDKVRSGMFVGVKVILPDKRDVVSVPVTAVVHAAYGDSVFIAEPKKDAAGKPQNGPDGKPAFVARQQFVRLGEMRGDFVAIEEGVKDTDEIVTAGAFKLRNGAPIAIKNDGAQKPSLSPTPENK